MYVLHLQTQEAIHMNISTFEPNVIAYTGMYMRKYLYLYGSLIPSNMPLFQCSLGRILPSSLLDVCLE